MFTVQFSTFCMFEIFYNKMLGRKIHVALTVEESKQLFELSQTWNTPEYNHVGLLSSLCSLSTFYVLSHLLSQPPME